MKLGCHKFGGPCNGTVIICRRQVYDDRHSIFGSDTLTKSTGVTVSRYNVPSYDVAHSNYP